MQIESLTGRLELEDRFSSVLNTISNNVERFAARSEKSFTAMSVATVAWNTALALLPAGIAATSVALANMGSNINDVKGSFASMSGGSRDAATNLEALRSGTRGMISDVKLMTAANHAMSAGARLTAEDWKLVGASAKELADRGLGSVTQNLDLINQALTTGQTRTLGYRLGVVNVKDAELAYADALGISVRQLDERQRAEARRAGTLDVLRQAMANTTASAMSFGDRFQHISAIFDNWLDRLASAVAASPAVQRALEDIESAIERFGNGQSIIDTIVGGIESLAKMAASAAPFVIAVANAFASAVEFASNFHEAIGALIVSWGAYKAISLVSSFGRETAAVGAETLAIRENTAAVRENKAAKSMETPGSMAYAVDMGLITPNQRGTVARRSREALAAEREAISKMGGSAVDPNQMAELDSQIAQLDAMERVRLRNLSAGGAPPPLLGRGASAGLGALGGLPFAFSGATDLLGILSGVAGGAVTGGVMGGPIGAVAGAGIAALGPILTQIIGLIGDRSSAKLTGQGGIDTENLTRLNEAMKTHYTTLKDAVSASQEFSAGLREQSAEERAAGEAAAKAAALQKEWTDSVAKSLDELRAHNNALSVERDAFEKYGNAIYGSVENQTKFLELTDQLIARGAKLTEAEIAKRKTIEESRIGDVAYGEQLLKTKGLTLDMIEANKAAGKTNADLALTYGVTTSAVDKYSASLQQARDLQRELDQSRSRNNLGFFNTSLETNIQNSNEDFDRRINALDPNDPDYATKRDQLYELKGNARNDLVRQGAGGNTQFDRQKRADEAYAQLMEMQYTPGVDQKDLQAARENYQSLRLAAMGVTEATQQAHHATTDWLSDADKRTQTYISDLSNLQVKLVSSVTYDLSSKEGIAKARAAGGMVTDALSWLSDEEIMAYNAKGGTLEGLIKGYGQSTLNEVRAGQTATNRAGSAPVSASAGASTSSMSGGSYSGGGSSSGGGGSYNSVYGDGYAPTSAWAASAGMTANRYDAVMHRDRRPYVDKLMGTHMDAALANHPGGAGVVPRSFVGGSVNVNVNQTINGLIDLLSAKKIADSTKQEIIAGLVKSGYLKPSFGRG